jgi:curved DNA-binding protein CbpA
VLNHYDMLNVDPTADVETIRRAWRVKVRLLHPDMHGSAAAEVRAEAASETRRINIAWNTLGDPDRRRRYDVRLAQDRTPRATVRRTPVPSSSRRGSGALTSLLTLDVASFLLVVVAVCCVVVGTALLAGMVQ